MKRSLLPAGLILALLLAAAPVVAAPRAGDSGETKLTPLGVPTAQMPSLTALPLPPALAAQEPGHTRPLPRLRPGAAPVVAPALSAPSGAVAPGLVRLDNRAEPREEPARPDPRALPKPAAEAKPAAAPPPPASPLPAKPAVQPNERRRWVSTEVNVRAKPARNAPRVDLLEEGMQVDIVGAVEGEWARVSRNGKLLGYVLVEFLLNHPPRGR